MRHVFATGASSDFRLSEGFATLKIIGLDARQR